MRKSYAPREFVRAARHHGPTEMGVHASLYLIAKPFYVSAPALVVELVDTLS